MLSQISEINKVQSFIPLYLKCIPTLDVKIDESLKVKGCTLVLTSPGENVSSKERTQEEEQTSSNHIIIQEANNLDSEI